MIHQDEEGKCVADCPIFVAVNAYWEPLEFELPGLGGTRKWKMMVNTAIKPGYFPKGRELSSPSRILLEPRSLVILSGRKVRAHSYK